MNFCELLDINEATARNLSRAYASYAPTQQRKEVGVQSDSPQGAVGLDERVSTLLLAGTYWLLLDVTQAAACFERASSISAESLHRDIAEQRRLESREISPGLAGMAASTVVLCILSGKPPSPHALKVVSEYIAVNPLPDFLALLLLVTAADSARGVDPAQNSAQFAELFVRYRATPVGRLGVPLSSYEQLAEALALPRGQMVEATGSWFNSIARRIDEAVAAARVDRYHWRVLYSTLLPFEPEVLSLFVAYEMRRQRLDEPPVRRRYRNVSTHPAVAYEEVARLLVRQHGLDAPPLPQRE